MSVHGCVVNDHCLEFSVDLGELPRIVHMRDLIKKAIQATEKTDSTGGQMEEEVGESHPLEEGEEDLGPPLKRARKSGILSLLDQKFDANVSGLLIQKKTRGLTLLSVLFRG